MDGPFASPGRLFALVAAGLAGLGWWVLAVGEAAEVDVLRMAGSVDAPELRGCGPGLALPSDVGQVGLAEGGAERSKVEAPRRLRLPLPRIRFSASYAQPRPPSTKAEQTAQLRALMEMDEGQLHDPEFHTAYMRGMLVLKRDPQGAFAMLQASGSTQAWLYAALDRPAADRVALELDPGHREVMQRLLRRDPAEAVLLIEAATEREGFVPTRGSRLNLAQAYASVERIEESAALLTELLDEAPKDGEAMELLLERDPQAAEERLWNLAEDGAGPWTLTLARLLAGEQRTREMVAVLSDGLDKSPGDLELVRSLESVAPGLAHDHLLSGHPALEVDAELASEFESLAWLHELSGDRARQIEAWQQATLRSPLNDTGTLSWPDGFEEEAPGRLIQAFEMRWTADSSLDFLGQLGTVYWRNGYELEAKSLWRSALESYPEEEAWQENLDAVEAGDSPPWFWR